MPIYHARPGAQSYGHDIGIILMSCINPFPPGDVGNARSYAYPVLYQVAGCVTIDGLINQADGSQATGVIAAAKALETEGVRAITSDCGYMLEYQDEVAAAVNVPVMMSSLLQLPFIASLLSPGQEIGIICAHAGRLEGSLLTRAFPNPTRTLRIAGMEQQPAFCQAILHEEGVLDSDKVEAETVTVARELVSRYPAIGALLLECSNLPLYSQAVQQALGLPVFDFLTMIDYVQSAVVRRGYPDGPQAVTHCCVPNHG